MKTTLYGTKTCPECVRAKEFLKENGVDFCYVNLTDNEKGIEAFIEKTGQTSVPVLEVDNKFIFGFTPEKYSFVVK